jgi:hypothetical protein
MSEIIEFNPKTPAIHSLTKKGPDYSNRICQHDALIVDEERGMVKCTPCGEEMSPLEALKVLCRRIWWEENGRERQLEYDAKRVSKVQTAAFQCLFEAGITPEKFAERWKKENEKRKAAAVEMKPDAVLLTPELPSGGAA